MGHISSKDAYRRLGDKIDNLTVRSPWSQTFYEILKELYSEEEADVVVKMPFGLASLRKIARTTKYSLRPRLGIRPRKCRRGPFA